MAAEVKGIICSAPMVRALLEGRKTQTRRLVKWPKWIRPDDHDKAAYSLSIAPDVALMKDGRPVKRYRCPHGRIGDHLYVKEAWKYANWTDEGHPLIEYRAGGDQWCLGVPEEWSDRVLDTWATLSDPENYAIDNRAADRRWRSPLHMPRWASRITLELTATRIERLHDITDTDARAEGVNLREAERAAVKAYYMTWGSLHGTNSWAANPYVWVLTFRRIER